MTATVYYVFLQARPPLTKDSAPEAIVKQGNNFADWELIATGKAVARDAEGRLKALKKLQQIMEKQGTAWQV
jgi:hypothetical protein